MNNEEIELLEKVFYIHKIDHRNGSGEKSQWTISEIEERDCFQYSLDSEWNAPEYTSWGLHFEKDKVVYLGKSAINDPELYQLFIAKFIDSSKINKWHGYPANPSSQKRQDIPPVKVLNNWLKKEYLRPQIIRKIQKGQKCKL